MFKKAIPVFAKGMENEMNLGIALRATVPSLSDTTLKITAFTFFRLTVNGEFVFFGPARAAVGHARVETIELGKYNREGNNELIIEATEAFDDLPDLSPDARRRLGRVLYALMLAHEAQRLRAHAEQAISPLLN